MLRIPNCAAISCCSSVLSFARINLPWYSSASLMRSGIKIWQGWHQLAQKSIRTGVCWESRRITCSKFSNVKSMIKGDSLIYKSLVDCHLHDIGVVMQGFNLNLLNLPQFMGH